MPETTSLARTLAPVKPVNESGRNFKPDNVPHSVRSGRDDSVINGDNSSISKKSATKTGQEPDDFDKVLSRKIDRQKEQTPDEHSQEKATPSETAELNMLRPAGCSDPGCEKSPIENTDEKNAIPVELNMTQCTSCSELGYGNSALGDMDEQYVPDQALPEMKMASDVQLAVNAGITGETMNPANQVSGQPSEQVQETVAQLSVSPEQSISMKIEAETELPVDEKQVHFQKAVII